jgi:hypothetical protein
MKKLLLFLVLGFVGLIALLIWQGDGDYQKRMAAADTPAKLAAAMLGSGKTEVEGDTALRIDYTVDDVLSASWAVSGFNLNTAKLVPAIFARFPRVQSIVFVESGPFTDIRGNKSTDTMFRIAFMRENADAIHWENINFDNVPKLGENYWMHPGIRRAAAKDQEKS